jgi:hypothetical protein
VLEGGRGQEPATVTEPHVLVQPKVLSVSGEVGPGEAAAVQQPPELVAVAAKTTGNACSSHARSRLATSPNPSSMWAITRLRAREGGRVSSRLRDGRS